MAQAKKPTTKTTAPEYRALTVYDSLPANHRTFAVTDASAAPHLRVGEFAVVDTTDREPQNGELYIIQWTGCDRRRAIVQVNSRYNQPPGHEPRLCWWVAALVRPRTLAAFEAEIEAGRRSGKVPVISGLSDGPYWTEGLQEKLVGRVVGVAFSGLGGVLAQAAGWENEEAGNAAFDAIEFVSILLAIGYKPLAYIDRDGLPRNLCIGLPHEALTDDEDAEARRVFAEFSKASKGDKMVALECIRRRLTYGGTPR